jgi:5'-nucleotidase
VTRRALCLVALVLLGHVGGCKKHRGSAPHPAPAQCLSIVGWNDLHGQLDADDPQLDTGRIPAGGVIALADHVDGIRKSGDAVVVLDAGDLFTGPMESTLAEGAPVIAAYNALGVDAAAVGNHEFDFGPVGYDRVTAKAGLTDAAGQDGPRGALFMRIREAKFPFLSANLRYTDGREVPNVKPHVIIARGAFRVGVVGYSTKETPVTTLKPNVAGLDFEKDAAARVATSVRELRAAGAFPVVMVAHASLEGDLPQELDDRNEHRGELETLFSAMGTDLPDLVIAGHRHAWMLGRVRGVPVVSSDQHGVGFARVRYCGKTMTAIERRVTFASNPPYSELGKKVASIVTPYLQSVGAAAEEVIATVPRLCVAQGPSGTALAEQIARSMLERAVTDQLVVDGASAVAVINAGGIRAPLHAGKIKYRDLFGMLPFENAISTCTTTRAGLLRALQNLSNKVSVRDRFPFGLAGATVRAKRTTTAPLEIVEVTPGGTGDTVTIVIPDFLLYGGDGFLNGVTCTASATSATRIRDAYRTVIAREPGGCDGAPVNIKMEAP